MKDELRVTSEARLFSCADCQTADLTSNFWFCRQCAKSVCGRCNIVESHTEHRSAPWRRENVLTACAAALEARCSRRTKEAADDEIAVKEFVAEFEECLTERLHRRLEADNESDRRKIAAIARALAQSHGGHVPTSGQVAWKTAPTDAAVSRLLVEAASETGLAALSVDALPASPRTGTYALLSGGLSPRHLAERVLSGAPSTSDWRQCSTDDGFHSNGEATDSPLVGRAAAKASTPVDDKSAGFGFPLEPLVRIASRRNTSFETAPDDSRSTTPLSPLADRLSVSDFGAADSECLEETNGSNVQLMISEVTQTAGDSERSCSATQTDADSRSATPTALQPMDLSGHSDDSAASTSTDATRLKVLSYYFGADFLTRPIDVCPVGENNLVVSDGCGGLILTNMDGLVLQRVPIEDASASSLCYNAAQHKLYASMMHRRGRAVRVYNVDGDMLTFVESVACPTSPKVEQNRTRWLATSERGALFAAAGDGRRSAVWLCESGDRWRTLVDLKGGSRLQHVCVAEEQRDHGSVVLLTCDAAAGRLLLYVVDRSGAVVADYDLSKSYGLRDYVRSPASAVVDRAGNMLLLDYASGKLWLLQGAAKGDRRLRLLAEVGAQQAIGLAARGNWCFVACFSRKRVQAIQYLDD